MIYNLAEIRILYTRAGSLNTRKALKWVWFFLFYSNVGKLKPINSPNIWQLSMKFVFKFLLVTYRIGIVLLLINLGYHANDMAI